MNKNIFFSRILFLSPHPDDIELGCGGFMTQLSRTETDMRAIIFSSEFQNAPSVLEENRKALNHFKINTAIHANFTPREFSNHFNETTNLIMSTAKLYDIDMIVCPSSNDPHPDHQTIYKAVTRFWKKDLICYEPPSSNNKSDFNFFIELQQKDLDEKIKALGEYESQIKLNRRYFDPQYITALALTRGINIDKKYAEAYKIERMCL
jgi:LmbE family N-acetylglucosaminyl deacetylase